MYLFKSILKCNLFLWFQHQSSVSHDLQKSFSYTAQETFLIIIMLKTVVLLHILWNTFLWFFDPSWVSDPLFVPIVSVHVFVSCYRRSSVSLESGGSQRSITCVSIHFLSFSSVLSHTDKVKPRKSPFSVEWLYVYFCNNIIPVPLGVKCEILIIYLI